MLSRFFAIGLFALLGTGLWGTNAHAHETEVHFEAMVPPLDAPSLIFQDDKDHTFALTDFRGKPVLLHLWATWCGPCVEELPSLDAYAPILAKKGVTVIAIAEDRAGADIVTSFYTRHGIKNLKVYVDTAMRAVPAFRVRGLPSTLFIDAKGKATGRLDGSVEWDEAPQRRLVLEKLGVR